MLEVLCDNYYEGEFEVGVKDGILERGL